jgi:hypothetical protein
MPDQLGHMLYTYEKSNRTSIDTLSLDIVCTWANKRRYLGLKTELCYIQKGACEPTGRRVGLRAINIIPAGGGVSRNSSSVVVSQI